MYYIIKSQITFRTSIFSASTDRHSHMTQTVQLLLSVEVHTVDNILIGQKTLSVLHSIVT